ncbi:MAG TPA: SDR family oxidoreductase [Thermoleophilaceae bacterium]|nr:SDR family oxidoreductase [Thermoleophilaceae bacterium]
MNLGLAGKSCVVTGASRGIGLASARGLCAEGASVLLVARGEAKLEAAAARCAEAGGRAEWLALDATEPGAAERVVEECERRLGSLDVLVNNAGTSAVKPLDQLSDEDWELQWQLSVIGPMRLMRAAAPRMAERGWGRIVNVASSSGKRPSGTNMAYSVGKAGQLSLSRAFADLYVRQGVLVNAVTPGPVESGLWMADGGMADQLAKLRGATREETLEKQRSNVPIGRYATEEEIAAVVIFLCSERASYVAGAAWSADGGTVQVII